MGVVSNLWGGMFLAGIEMAWTGDWLEGMRGSSAGKTDMGDGFKWLSVMFQN
jgi:hypothetical protein